MAAIRDSQDRLQTRMHSLLKTHIPRPDNSRGFRRGSLETQIVSITTIAKDPRAKHTANKTTELQGQTRVNRRVIQSITGSIKKKKKGYRSLVYHKWPIWSSEG